MNEIHKEKNAKSHLLSFSRLYRRGLRVLTHIAMWQLGHSLPPLPPSPSRSLLHVKIQHFTASSFSSSRRMVTVLTVFKYVEFLKFFPECFFRAVFSRRTSRIIRGVDVLVALNVKHCKTDITQLVDCLNNNNRKLDQARLQEV